MHLALCLTGRSAPALLPVQKHKPTQPAPLPVAPSKEEIHGRVVVPSLEEVELKMRLRMAGLLEDWD
jgi:hypothetical protein